MNSLFPTCYCCRDSTIFLDNNGIIWHIGNLFAEDTSRNNFIIPKQLEFSGCVKMIAAGFNHIIFCDYNDNVYSLGSNTYGQLGIKSYINQKIPVKVNLPPIDQVRANSDFSVCLSCNGDVYTFGDGSFGTLGNEKQKKSNIPVLVKGINNINYIECGGNHVICRNNNNEYYGWGNGNQGQLGIGECSVYPFPIKCISFPDNIKSIKCGYAYTLILTDSGLVYSCGSNLYGQLGIQVKTLSIATQIEALPEIQRISCGNYHSLCIDIENKLWLFGSNSYGQVAVEKQKHQIPIPYKYSNDINVIDISFGTNATLLKTIDNEIYAIGDNNQLKLGKIILANIYTPTRVLEGKEDIWSIRTHQSRQKSARK